MRSPALYRKTLRDVRGMAIGIGATAFAMALLVVLIYPTYSETFEDFEMPEAMSGFLGEAESYATPEGFASAEIFSWLPLLVVTIAIIAGTAATAGEEGNGTLDLVLAQPVRRTRVLGQKAGAIVVALALSWAATLPGLLFGKAFVEFDLSPWAFTQALLMSFSMILVYFTFTLWMGALLPNRGAAAMVCIAAVVVPYILYTIGSAVSDLSGLRKLTPFYWADASHVLVRGFDWWRFGGLMAIAALFYGLAVLSFQRRDIAAGAREWSLRDSLRRALATRREAPAKRPLTRAPL